MSLNEKYFVVISNLERRNMHAFARAWIVFNIEPIISEMARRREYGGVTLSANTERGYTRISSAKWQDCMVKP